MVGIASRDLATASSSLKQMQVLRQVRSAAIGTHTRVWAHLFFVNEERYVL